jgi:hypothetical protein
MSKFADKLKHISQAAPQPMGFGRRQEAEARPEMLLVAKLAGGGASKLAGLVAGADAGLVDISESGGDDKMLRKCVRAVPDIPWGGWLKGERRPGGGELECPDCDFVVLPAAQTPVGILENATEVGRILEVSASLNAGILRTINDLPVDGVLITFEDEGSPALTWQRLMTLQHFADLLAKPLLTEVPPEVSAGELKMLWEAGVDGVIVEVGTGRPGSQLKRLREAISELPSPSSGRRGKVKALLPKTGQETTVAAEEELPADLR